MNETNPHARLPALGALRAFEAAARHLSFAKAADELAVTPAAVSHQMKALEDWLGVALFVRRTRGVGLTPAGEALLPGVREGFQRLVEAVEMVTALAGKDGPLVVTAGPAFAAKWLIPRLESLQRRHPDLDVRLWATLEAIDLRAGKADIAVRYGAGDYPGMRVHHLFGDKVLVVCAPELAARLGAPDDLLGFRLLHDATMLLDPTAPDWRMWLRLAGLQHPDAEHGLTFNHADHAIAAAAAGVGVLLSRVRLTADEVRAGRLVAPFELTLPSSFAYWLVYPEGADRRPKVAAFRDWLLQAVADDGGESGRDK